MRPLKLALVVDHFLPRIGGIELHLRDLAAELKKAGVEPHIITGTPGEGSLSNGVPIHRLPIHLMPGFHILYRPRDFKLLRDLLVREEFDLVHAHGSVVSPLAYASLYWTHRLKIPSLLTTHSLLQLSSYLLRPVGKWLPWSKWPAALSGISENCARGLARAAGRPKVHILPNGIHPELWRQERPAPKSRPQITTVLRLNKKKGAQHLIRQIPYILSKLPRESWPQFKIIGKGPYAPFLKRLINKYGLEEQVHLTGYLSREEIKKVFSKSDLFVLPTTKEAFGIAVLEARCAGLPVVAMNYGGLPDLIAHGHNGYLAKNHRQMADHILNLLQHPGRRQEMSEKTLTGLETFSWEGVIQRHLELYAQIMGAKKEHLSMERRVG